MICKINTVFVVLCMFAALWSSTFAQRNLGNCPENSAMKQFDLEKYAGRWYGYKALRPMLHYNGVGCFRETLEVQGKEYKVTDAMLSPTDDQYDRTRYRGKVLKGGAKPDGNPGEGKLLVTLSNKQGITRTRTDYILDTDYSNYSIVYTCRNEYVKKIKYYIETYWVFSRTKELPEASSRKADIFLQSVKKDFSEFVRVSQDSVEGCSCESIDA